MLGGSLRYPWNVRRGTGDLWPGLARTIIAANAFQVATAPLSDDLRRSILPEGRVCSDTRKLLLYFRLDHTGRLLMGGRGPFPAPRAPGDWAHLERIVAKPFPRLGGVAFEHRWCGRAAITRDFLPHLHEPAPGLLIDIGCQGRGVGLQSAMARAIAAYVATGDADALPDAGDAAAPPLRLGDRRVVPPQRRRRPVGPTGGGRRPEVAINPRRRTDLRSRGGRAIA